MNSPGDPQYVCLSVVASRFSLTPPSLFSFWFPLNIHTLISTSSSPSSSYTLSSLPRDQSRMTREWMTMMAMELTERERERRTTRGKERETREKDNERRILVQTANNGRVKRVVCVNDGIKWNGEWNLLSHSPLLTSLFLGWGFSCLRRDILLLLLSGFRQPVVSGQSQDEMCVDEWDFFLLVVFKTNVPWSSRVPSSQFSWHWKLYQSLILEEPKETKNKKMYFAREETREVRKRCCCREDWRDWREEGETDSPLASLLRFVTKKTVTTERREGEERERDKRNHERNGPVSEHFSSPAQSLAVLSKLFLWFSWISLSLLANVLHSPDLLFSFFSTGIEGEKSRVDFVAREAKEWSWHSSMPTDFGWRPRVKPPSSCDWTLRGSFPDTKGFSLLFCILFLNFLLPFLIFFLLLLSLLWAFFFFVHIMIPPSHTLYMLSTGHESVLLQRQEQRKK